MIRIYSASNITEANIVAGMLIAHDIDAHVGGQFLQGAVGDLPPMDIASVNVADDQADAARALIEQYESHTDDTPVRPSTEQPAWQEPLIYALIIGAILGLYFLL